MEFRSVGRFDFSKETFAFSKRHKDPDFSQYARISGQYLADIKKNWTGDFEFDSSQLSSIKALRIARFYIMRDDGGLVSLPIAPKGRSLESAQTIDSECEEFQKNSLSPRLVSDNFFFRFRYDQPLKDQVVYSGTYLDLGGSGLIATVSRPIILNGRRCVLGADISFDVSWKEFARNLSPNIFSHVSTLEDLQAGEVIWDRILDTIPQEESGIRNSVASVAESQRELAHGGERKSAYIAAVPGGGDAMAIQVDRSTWLLLVLNTQNPALPWMTMSLTAIAFGCLMVHMELARRNADHSRRMAIQEIQEKQNLLETMQVPLMVVDPNTDQLVYCNLAAQNIGMEMGQLFGRDVVADQPEAVAAYRENQFTTQTPRRAYGVPIRLGVEDGYAIVRSVAVTAPIPSLSADRRHRLGILFVLDEKQDLALLIEKRKGEASHQERQKLSGLMSHGVELFTRVLARQLEASFLHGRELEPEVAIWISQYVNQKLRLVCWALDNWGAGNQAKDRQETLLDGRSIDETLQKIRGVLTVVSKDRALREQLHWNNGPIGKTFQTAEGLGLECSVDWPEDVYVKIPYEGVFGFFIGETLVNAVRHGASDSPVAVRVEFDPVRRDVQFEVSNGLRNERSGNGIKEKAYGGLAILREIASLCQWNDLQIKESDGQFSVMWRVPAVPVAGKYAD